MPENPKFLAERLLTEGNRSVQFFQDLPPAAWNQTIYLEGASWNAYQILAHFVVSEVSFYALIQDILQGGSGAPEDFNIDSYNEREVKKQAGVKPETLLEEFLTQRTLTAAAVSGLNPETLQIQGRHPFLGVAPLEQIIKLIYRHNQIHQREMRKAFDDNR